MAFADSTAAADGKAPRARTGAGGGARHLRLPAVGWLLAATVVALLAGCGGSSSHSTSSSSGSSSSAEAARPPDRILSDSAAALRTAPSYLMQGTIDQEHQRLALRLATIAPSSIDLSFSLATATAEVISLPNAGYIRGNVHFWSAQVGPRATQLAGRWIRVPASSVQSATSGLGALAPGTLARCLAEGHGTLTNAGRAEIDGRSAILIKDAGDKPGSTPGVLAVAATGTPYPLRYTATGGQRAGGHIDVCNDGKGSDSRGTITFGQFGQVAPIQAPKVITQSSSTASA